MKGIFVLFAVLALANCSTFLRNLAACTATTEADLKKITNEAQCLDCNGVFVTSGETSYCECMERFSFDASNGGCVAPECTIKKQDELTKVTDKDKCLDCFLVYNATGGEGKICSCPSEEDASQIIDQTACKTVCGFKWDDTHKVCSGMYIKIASALFVLLFLL